MHTSSFIFLGFVLWIILAFWPAYVAKRRGRSFLLFFILGIFISWLLALILAYILPDKNETPQSREADRAAEKALAKEENS
jgi:phosphotransferase system  glucose/maltose/N-acetylglucosamine-specific IIC component